MCVRVLSGHLAENFVLRRGEDPISELLSEF